MIDSPIKWVGGKSKLRSEVIKRLPTDAECYVEAFAGAAWVLFGKQPHPVEVINDANGDLVNLWRVLKWRPAELLEEIQQHLYSREMFEEIRAVTPSVWDEMGRAVRTYLLVKMAYGGDLSHKPRWGYGTKPNISHFLENPMQKLFPASARLQGVLVENGDFEKVISRYDQKRTIFFCDPPYLDTYGYEETFTLSDHCRLCASLSAIEGRFLMTVNDHPAIREMYSAFVIEEAKEARCLSSETEGRVAAPILFISNYQPQDGGLFAEEDYDAEDDTE